jgi:Kef-type K+ transport system membrane component KefB
MSPSELFLVAMGIIFSLPYLLWRLGRTDYYAPLVVIQIITGIVLGPGVLGALLPSYYNAVFNAGVLQALNGIAWWGVMIFVWIAGLELDLAGVWAHRRESTITAGLALGTPLLLGCAAACGMVLLGGWMGPHASKWQFVLGIGMACAVTALPVLILLLEKLAILRLPIGQRILRYASMDDVAIWGVLALILMDWSLIGRQLIFLVTFAIAAFGFRRLMVRLPERDRWYCALIWLALCGLAADRCGLHFMVGAFLSGAVMESRWLDQKQLDTLRQNLLLIVMPVYFLSTGLRTAWVMGGSSVLLTAGALLVVSLSGKLLGVKLAGALLRWQPGESSLISWLLQTKGLIMIAFANVLLDKGIINASTFTALLLMAIGSTMLTVPMVTPKLRKLQALIWKAA